MRLQHLNEDLLASSDDAEDVASYDDTEGIASHNETAGTASPDDTPSNHHDAAEPTGDTHDDEPSPEESSEEEPYGPGRGRPPHYPTPENRERVFKGARWGELQTEIAKFLNIDPKTLRKHYSEELKRGSIEANNAVMESLFHMATKREKVGAAIFWAKTRCALRPGGIPYDTAPGAPDPKVAAASQASKRSSRASDEPFEYKPVEFHVYCNDGEPNYPY